MTAKLYAIQADSLCTAWDKPESEGSVDILFKNVAAKKADWATRHYWISKDIETTVKSIYRLDAYMTDLIDYFGDSITIGGNDLNDIGTD